jgi:hypothetical protein
MPGNCLEQVITCFEPSNLPPRFKKSEFLVDAPMQLLGCEFDTQNKWARLTMKKSWEEIVFHSDIGGKTFLMNAPINRKGYKATIKFVAALRMLLDQSAILSVLPSTHPCCADFIVAPFVFWIKAFEGTKVCLCYAVVFYLRQMMTISLARISSPIMST